MTQTKDRKTPEETGETLAQVADREATTAELQQQTNDVGELGTDDLLGDEQAAEPAPYQPPTPTRKQSDAAKRIAKKLEDGVFNTEETIEGLIGIVDVHPDYCTAAEWPGKAADEYHKAKVIQQIATVLCAGCAPLTLDPRQVVFLFRNKEKWMDGDSTRAGQSSKFDGRTQFLQKRLVCVEINYHHWLTLNPLQKVFRLFHELRSRSVDGSVRRPDFTGYHDELALFGVRVFHETMALAQSVMLGSAVELDHQLPLFTDDPDAQSVH